MRAVGQCGSDSFLDEYGEVKAMKQRPSGFLSEENISHESEIFDYIRELHEYLWLFVRCEIPEAQGNLSDYLGRASELARQRAASHD